MAIAEKVRASQDQKEMERRAIKLLKNLGGETNDLEQDFWAAYGEQP